VKELFSADVSGMTEVKGTVASKGKAQGPARVVFSIRDIEKVQPGEVLVTSMTRPEHVPAMRKAAAIVTDDGGITCHAAIVSRELKKPCVIGTKMATKVFKDGDMVEVDAEKGIVRKI
jgi:pyruvate,water dikinase